MPPPYFGYHNLSPRIPWAVTQVRTTFVHPHHGRSFSAIGTGFWLQSVDGHLLFITNRHNVAPRDHPQYLDYELDQVELHLRPMPEGKTLYDPGKFFVCTGIAAKLYTHATADVAIIVDPSCANAPLDYAPCPIIDESVVADAHWIRTELQMMEECFFVGYPGISSSRSLTGVSVRLYDTKKMFPVARQAVIASSPETEFENEHVKTSAAILVSGMSFTGSSGSPVFVPAYGVPSNAAGLQGPFRPARLIGIMSGHFDTRDADGTLHHAGVSYLTGSHAIRMLIDEARGDAWTKNLPQPPPQP